MCSGLWVHWLRIGQSADFCGNLLCESTFEVITYDHQNMQLLVCIKNMPSEGPDYVA